MDRRLFGTDGIRGLANTHPMTAEVALALGKAAGRLFTARRPPPPRGDRQGHAAVRLHARAGADRGLRLGRA